MAFPAKIKLLSYNLNKVAIESQRSYFQVQGGNASKRPLTVRLG